MIVYLKITTYFYFKNYRPSRAMSKSISNAYSDAIKKRIHKDSVCWWCTYPFDSVPICVPFKYEEKKSKFYLEGYFCSWQCGKAYVLDKNSADKFNQCTLITLLHKRMSGKISSIKAAPSRFNLQKFGGNLTIEQFRQNNVAIAKMEFNKNECFQYHPHGNSINNLNVESTVKKSNDKQKSHNTSTTPLLLNEESINNRSRNNRKIAPIEPKSKTTKTSLENFMNITITK